MFELKKGMKVQIKKFTDIYTFKEIDVLKNEYYLYSFDNVIFKHTPDEIDWKETAKLNGINLDIKKNNSFEEVSKNVGELFKTMNSIKEYNPKYDKGKRDYTLIPINELEQVLDVLEYGCKKYSPNAWKGVENGLERYKKAMLRHMMSYLKGEEFDKESGLSHLSHLATNVLFMMWFENNKEE